MSFGGLVAAYGSSEEESDGDSSPEIAPVAPVAGKRGLALPAPKHVKVDEKSKEEPKTAAVPEPRSIFSSLPAPKRDVLADLIVEETDEPVPVSKNGTTVKQKVKISIPSLSQFTNEEEDAPKPKKIKLAPKGSGLLALLPEPVNGLTSRNTFMPYVLTKKPAPKPVPKKTIPLKPAVSKKAELVSNYSESDESEEEGGETSAHTSTSTSGIDFFSLTNQVKPAPVEVNLDEYLPVAGPSRPDKIPVSTYAVIDEEENLDESEQQDEPSELTDEAIRKLCGKRGEDMSNMIEIEGESVFKEAKEWMLKNITEEQEKDYSHRDKQPNSNQKRKHQITYLAYQAKERETELKNQWADNRQSKKQTQAKYGF